MKDLIPRQFDETEAKRYGIQSGWYGTKHSGTFVTGPSLTLEDCLKAMKEAPEPPPRVVESVIDAVAVELPPKPAARSFSDIAAYNVDSRASYRIGRRPR